MNKVEILRKVRSIEIKSNFIANELFSGSYHSRFKGNGMEFSDIRRYAIGDDIKKIDWKVTAKQRKAYVKEFVEERELSIYILVDTSSSVVFGKQKERVAEIIGTLALSANKNNDKVGAILFSDKIEKIHNLKKGRKHSLAILDSFLQSRDDLPKKTKLNSALDFFNKVIKKRSVVFLISDFYDKGYEKSMKLLSQKHDLITVCLRDSKFKELPKGAIFTFTDSETGEEIMVDSLKQNIELDGNFSNKNGITLNLEEDYVKKFIKFFSSRGRR